MNIQMAKKWTEMVVKRSFIKEHSFRIGVYNPEKLTPQNILGFLVPFSVRSKFGEPRISGSYSSFKIFEAHNLIQPSKPITVIL